MFLRRVIEHVKTQNWFAVALDFVIVVVGVYTAVWIEGAQRDAEERKQTALVIETLRNDLRDSIGIETRFTEAMQEGLEDWQEKFEAGGMPPPYFFRVPGSDTAPLKPWDAMLSMGLGELLHPQLVFDLAFYYSEREGVGRKYIRYVTFVEGEILPRLKQDPSVFYLADGSRLKPEYEANMDLLRDFKREQYNNLEWAKCLDARLEFPGDEGSCASSFDYEDVSGDEPGQ